MKATSRHLFGEDYQGHLITCSADDPDAYRKLLKEAGRIVEATEACGVTLSGITWDQVADEYVLELITTHA